MPLTRQSGNGQLTHASRPGLQLDFVYDDGNQRLLKRVDGVPVRADVALADDTAGRVPNWTLS